MILLNNIFVKGKIMGDILANIDDFWSDLEAEENISHTFSVWFEGATETETELSSAL